jgi:hypothetical protein
LLFLTKQLAKRWKRGGKSWERRTKTPLLKRGRKEEQRCGKEEK